MTFSTIQTFLMPIAFTFLLILMLLYWGQAAFFGTAKYNKLTALIFQLSFLSITSLLVLRWIDSGHFPLSNLYESLLFLSWSFLLVHLLLGTRPEIKKNGASWGTKRRSKQSFLHAMLDDYKALSEKYLAIQHENLGLKNLYVPNENYFADRFGLGVILSPMALLTFGFAFLSLPKDMQKATALVPALQSNWLMMHVTVMICSYAALLCGSVLSIAFLVIHRFEKTKQHRQQDKQSPVLRFRAMYAHSGLTSTKNNSFDKAYDASQQKTKLPSNVDSNNDSAFINDAFYTKDASFINHPTQKTQREHTLAARLDNYSYRILALGFPLLTVGILSGAVWANEAWGSYWSWDPKETWALITWLVFAIYLHTRITKGWNGEKSALVASLGFFVVWFCYLGVNLLGTGLHSYGWFSNSNL